MEQTTQSHSKPKEITIFAITAILIAMLLKIIFYSESTITILKITAAFFWLFVLPGYFMTLIWRYENNFFERIIISVPMSVAILGITSYYLGKAGVNLGLQSWILPPTIIILTGIIRLLKDKKDTTPQ